MEGPGNSGAVDQDGPGVALDEGTEYKHLRQFECCCFV